MGPENLHFNKFPKKAKAEYGLGRYLERRALDRTLHERWNCVSLVLHRHMEALNYLQTERVNE